MTICSWASCFYIYLNKMLLSIMCHVFLIQNLQWGVYGSLEYDIVEICIYTLFTSWHGLVALDGILETPFYLTCFINVQRITSQRLFSCLSIWTLCLQSSFGKMFSCFSYIIWKSCHKISKDLGQTFEEIEGTLKK